MKMVVIDDEIAALNTFLPNVIDGEITCAMYKDNPLAALDYVRNGGADVAVIDVKMPKIDGVTLAEKILEAAPDVKIIFLTAYAQDEAELKSRFGDSLAGILYKPYDGADLNRILSSVNSAPHIYLKTFNAFDLFVNGSAVEFTSSKAKELLALLTDADGSYVGIDSAVCNLWPDKDVEHGKRLYRDAVCRLRLTLRENGAGNLVKFERGRAVINKSAAKCDLWTSLSGAGGFSGRYMPEYGWSVATENALVDKYGR